MRLLDLIAGGILIFAFGLLLVRIAKLIVMFATWKVVTNL